MIKKIASIVLISALLLFSTAAYASGNEIVVSMDGDDTFDISTTAKTIDVPIKLDNVDDVYAFTIKMDYSPDNVTVEGIVAGDVFSDFGSAVLNNSVDNESGKVSYMQTLLSVDEGISEDKTLCIIRLTFVPGEYDISSDLGLSVEIVNSNPEYVDVNLSSGTITINESTDGDEPVETLEPLPTSEPGIIDPDPESDQADDFEHAEDENYKEVLEAVVSETKENESEEQTETTEQVQSEKEDTIKVQATVENEEPIEEKKTLPLWALILIVIGGVLLVGFGVFFYLIKVKNINLFVLLKSKLKSEKSPKMKKNLKTKSDKHKRFR